MRYVCHNINLSLTGLSTPDDWDRMGNLRVSGRMMCASVRADSTMLR